MPEDTKALLEEVRQMNVKIDNLSSRITIGHKAIRRLTGLTMICALFLLGGIIASFFIVDLYQGVSATQTRSCENRNESAKANLTLWTYVISVSESSNPHPTAREEHFYDDMRSYVSELYAPRDCDDLTKKYPAPRPPKIPPSQR